MVEKIGDKLGIKVITIKKSLLVIMSLIILSVLCSCSTKDINKKEDQIDKNPNISNEENTDNDEIVERDKDKQKAEYEVENLKDPQEVYIESSEVIKIKGLLEDGRYWLELAVTDDNRIIGYTNTVDNVPSEMLYYDIESGKVEFFYTLELGFSPSMVQINDKYIMWNEHVQHDYETQSTKIILYEKATGEIFTLDERLNVSVNLPYDYIALGDERILWATGYMKGEEIIHCIKEYDMKKKQATIIKEMAIKPTIGKDFWAWIEPADKTYTRNVICIEDSNGNIEKIDSKEISPYYITTYDDKLAYSGITDAKNAKSALVLYDDESVKRIEYTNSSDYYQFPDMNDRFIGWRGTDKLRLYSIEEEKVYILTDKNAGYTDVRIDNNYAMWHGPVIEDEHEAKMDALENGMYLSYIYLLKLD